MTTNTHKKKKGEFDMRVEFWDKILENISNVYLIKESCIMVLEIKETDDELMAYCFASRDTNAMNSMLKCLRQEGELQLDVIDEQWELRHDIYEVHVSFNKDTIVNPDFVKRRIISGYNENSKEDSKRVDKIIDLIRENEIRDLLHYHFISGEEEE